MSLPQYREAMFNSVSPRLVDRELDTGSKVTCKERSCNWKTDEMVVKLFKFIQVNLNNKSVYTFRNCLRKKYFCKKLGLKDLNILKEKHLFLYIVAIYIYFL